MQIPIPFNESLMPADLWTVYNRTMDQIPEIRQVDRRDIISTAQSAILTIRKSMDYLRVYSEKVQFSDRTSEISFFKTVKPQFHSRLIFWLNIYDIELNRPVGGKKCEIKFIKKRLSGLEEFFQRHKDFYQYLRSAQTNRDEEYFLRNQSLGKIPADPSIIEVNPYFTTTHDYIVSAILGNDMISQYLSDELCSLRSKAAAKKTNPEASKLHWTASKTGLVELLYALHTSGVFNDGKAKVQDIATIFQDQFDVKLLNYYHTFNELRSRKKNRTVFLQSLRDKLALKMDELEGS